jgi:hypothetical protein
LGALYLWLLLVMVMVYNGVVVAGNKRRYGTNLTNSNPAERPLSGGQRCKPRRVTIS